MDELDREAARLDHVAGVVRDHFCFFEQAVLLKLELDETERQRRGVHGRVDGLQNVGQRADVILVAVRDKKAAQLVLIFCKIGNVGDDQIHAVHIVLREAEAAVDDDHVLAVFQHGHVLADLVQTAQRDDF